VLVVSLVQGDIAWTYDQCVTAWGKPVSFNTSESSDENGTIKSVLYHFICRRTDGQPGHQLIFATVENGKVVREMKMTSTLPYEEIMKQYR
jgi:hypothetical protein